MVAKKCTQNVVRVHSCCFAILNLLLLCRSGYCRSCRCLSLTTSLCRGDWGKHFPVAQFDKKRVLSQAQPLNSQYPEAHVVKEPKPYLWTLYQYIVFDIILKLAFIYSWNDFIWHQDRQKVRAIYTNPRTWLVPHACAQPYHPGSGSYGQLFRP